MTEKQAEILLHTIGMEHSNYRRSLAWWLDNDKHRNHYYTKPGCDGFSDIEFLVAEGMMERGRPAGEDGWGYFHATDLGIKTALELFKAKVKS